MHAKENKSGDISHMQHWLKLKNLQITNQTSKLNFDRTIGFLRIKTSKQDPTWLYFDKKNLYFLITVIYSVIARTTRMKCQSKWEQLSEQVYMSSRATNMLPRQIRTRVRHMLLLQLKQDITIARTRYYYIPNKFVCHLEKKVSEQMRTTVRTKSNYSRNNFVCHLEQK
jgi:hypothetical protein